MTATEVVAEDEEVIRRDQRQSSNCKMQYCTSVICCPQAAHRATAYLRQTRTTQGQSDGGKIAVVQPAR